MNKNRWHCIFSLSMGQFLLHELDVVDGALVTSGPMRVYYDDIDAEIDAAMLRETHPNLIIEVRTLPDVPPSRMKPVNSSNPDNLVASRFVAGRGDKFVAIELRPETVLVGNAASLVADLITSFLRSVPNGVRVGPITECYLGEKSDAALTKESA